MFSLKAIKTRSEACVSQSAAEKLFAASGTHHEWEVCVCVCVINVHEYKENSCLCVFEDCW